MKLSALGKLRSAVAQVQEENREKESAAVATDDSPTIKVCVRVRPFIKEEIDGERSSGKCELCIGMPTTTRCEMFGKDDTRTFDFDRCYWSHSKDHPLYATQETLQKELGETMLDHAMNGFNNCIFAYGQTGSGKSFSVLGGSGEARGLLPRVVEGLFSHFQQLGPDVTCKTLVAFIEIYNEQIRDLLAPRDGDEKDKKLEVKQHPVLGTIIPGLTEAAVGSCDEVLGLVEYGTTMRHVSATAMNATSSRSHCIFTFKTSLSEGAGKAKMSQTHLVDLAGSERAGRTKATGDRLKEGAAINQSLSTLARVISELAKKKRRGNPPFRDSKLTYILKESLCGNSKTVMMAAISPNLLDYDETLSTMKFAQSVKQVQTKAVCNEVNEKGIEAQLRQELEALRQQLQRYESGAGPEGVPSLVEAQKRLKEQEQLCAWFGKDWDALLAEERNRMRKRTRILNEADVMALREQFAHKLSEDGEEGSGSSESDSSEASEEEASCPLAYFGEAVEETENPQGPRSRLRLPPRSAVAVNGPAARQMLQGSPHELAEALTQQLRQRRADAEAAEKVATVLSGDNVPSVQIRAVVVVEPDEEEPRAEVVVRVRRGGLTEAEGGTTEYITGEELRRRMVWLKAAKAAGGARAAERGDAWVAATAATSERRPSQAGQGGAGGASEEEVAALRAQLAEAEAELARLRSGAGALPGTIVRAAGEKGLDTSSGAASPASAAASAATTAAHRAIAKAIAASFDNAIAAIDKAQASLGLVGLDERGRPLGPQSRHAAG